MLNKDDGYVYDYLGNVTYEPDDSSTPRTRYYYNDDNLLSQVDDVTGGGTTSTTITWNANKQRLKLQRGNDTWEMIYDVDAGIPAVLLAKNYVNSSATYMYNVREPNGELLCSFDASETPNNYYYHFDNLGSTVLVTNGSGTTSDSFTYSAWGDILNSPPNDRKPYQFVGELGYYAHTSFQGTALGNLMQLGVRFYGTATGRFTQRDPLRTDQSSDYVYALDCPTTLSDPTGLKCDPCKPGGSFDCATCQERAAKKCRSVCKRWGNGANNCTAACTMAIDQCGNRYCGSSTDSKGFLLCATAALTAAAGGKPTTP